MMPKKKVRNNDSPKVNPMPPEGDYSGAGVGSFMSNVKSHFYANAPAIQPKKKGK